MPTVGQGGTIRLRAVYRDGSYALVDPVTPLVDILDPGSVETSANNVPTRESLGNYYYDYTAGVADQLGTWTARWTGTINGSAVEGLEEFEVVPAGTVSSSSGLLVDLTKYKLVIGETDSANDERHTEALEDASAAVLNYTDRDFASTLVTEDRTYWYNGGGVLEIDDCSAVNSCDYAGWEARREGPASVNVYSYLTLPTFDPRRADLSGAMGFTRNLDTFFAAQQRFDEVEVTVNADWGWDTVPDDVQRAVIWTAVAYEAVTPAGGGGYTSGVIQSESVAEVARAYAIQENLSLGPGEVLPSRAAAILGMYRRHVL